MRDNVERASEMLAKQDQQRLRVARFWHRLMMTAKEYMRAYATKADAPKLAEHVIAVDAPAAPDDRMLKLLSEEADVIASLTLPEGFVVVRADTLRFAIRDNPTVEMIVEDGARQLEAYCAYRRRDWKFGDER